MIPWMISVCADTCSAGDANKINIERKDREERLYVCVKY